MQGEHANMLSGLHAEINRLSRRIQGPQTIHFHHSLRLDNLHSPLLEVARDPGRCIIEARQKSAPLFFGSPQPLGYFGDPDKVKAMADLTRTLARKFDYTAGEEGEEEEGEAVEEEDGAAELEALQVAVRTLKEESQSKDAEIRRLKDALSSQVSVRLLSSPSDWPNLGVRAGKGDGGETAGAGEPNSRLETGGGQKGYHNQPTRISGEDLMELMLVLLLLLLVTSTVDSGLGGIGGARKACGAGAGAAGERHRRGRRGLAHPLRRRRRPVAPAPPALPLPPPQIRLHALPRPTQIHFRWALPPRPPRSFFCPHLSLALTDGPCRGGRERH